jgi:hypothetical protein
MLKDYWVVLKRPETFAYKNKDFRELKIQKARGDEIIQVPIPFSFFPMKENAVISVDDGKYQYVYQRGILAIVVKGPQKITLKVKVNPDFTVVEKVDINKF